MRNLLNRQDGQGLVEYYAVILLLTFVVVAVIFGLLAQDSTDGDAGQTFGDGIEYDVFYVEGMPCIWALSSYQKGYAGLTCDWSQWNGP